MNYKETLFFVAKCLTISLEEKNRQEIEVQLKNDEINWESVVKVSTAHYVFPALYCNFKRASFLHYLPKDLVQYMQHITDLNRERNQQIIEQAKEINSLLLTNNITPIFLKGTGNLLEGLYDDVAERMVGDIDFIVEEQFYAKAFDILKNDGYETVTKEDYHFPQFKHQPRLTKKSEIAAVEVHKELIIEEYASEFNYSIISKNTLKNDNFFNFLSFDNQLALSILAKQINDDGFHFNDIALRNAYDVFLLSKKTNSEKTLKKFKKLYHPLNNFLAICNTTFENVDTIKYVKNNESETYIKTYVNSLENLSKTKIKNQKIDNNLFVKKRLQIIKKAILDKKTRNWLLKRVRDKNWQQQKLIQLGLKKPKLKS